MNIPRSTVVAFALLTASAAAWAQTTAPGSTSDPMGKGQSARCDTMTGEQREQCLRDENAKTQNAPASPAAGDSATSGSSSAAPATEPSSSGSSTAVPSTDSSSSTTGTPSSSDTSSGSLPATKSE